LQPWSQGLVDAKGLKCSSVIPVSDMIILGCTKRRCCLTA